MWLLAAAISPGYFGFTNWAFAAEAPSEIAAQVPIATRKNNALIIVSLPFLPCDQLGCNIRQSNHLSKVGPERGVGRCDDHHEMVDRKKPRGPRSARKRCHCISANASGDVSSA